MNSKLLKELPHLVDAKIITPEVATNIEAYYQSKASPSSNKLFTVFGVLGSLLLGLGVILILAHNWDHFNRMTKTIFAFFPLVIGQVFVAFSIIKRKSNAWRESSGTFLFFAIGSSIALVSQIYNIPGNLSTYVLTWIILSLPLIYLLKSNTIALLNIVFVTFYAIEIGYAGYFSMNQTPWMYLVIMLAILPHYLMLLKMHKAANITSIFNWVFPLSLTIVVGAFVKDISELGFLMYVLLFSLFYNLGKLPIFQSQKLRRNGFLIFGSLGIVLMLLTMSFDSFWYVDHFFFGAQESLVSVVLFMANVFVLLYAHFKKRLRHFNLFQYIFVFCALLYVFGLNVPVIGTIAINCIVFALGITTIKIGADQFHFGILNYGLIIITALVTCRFFDTNMSFELRGLLFVLVGLGFFFTNYIMLKRQKSRVELQIKNHEN